MYMGRRCLTCALLLNYHIFNFPKKKKMALSDILEESTCNSNLLLHSIEEDFSLKSTYVLSRYGKIPKANQEVISWPLFASTFIFLHLCGLNGS